MSRIIDFIIVHINRKKIVGINVYKKGETKPEDTVDFAYIEKIMRNIPNFGFSTVFLYTRWSKNPNEKIRTKAKVYPKSI